MFECIVIKVSPQGALDAIKSWGPPPKDRKYEEHLEMAKERDKLAEFDTDRVNDELQVGQLDIRFIENLEHGNSISLLYNSCQKSKKTIEFIDSKEGKLFKVSVKINGLHVADGVDTCFKDAKRNCADNAVNFLKSRGIQKFKTHQNMISEDAVSVISKDTLTGKMEPLRIEDDNIGNKMLKMMGWTGDTGLGKDGQGIANPVSSVGQTSRGGLGSSSSEFAISKQSVQEQLLAFMRDSSIEKLEFSKDLDNTERKIIHNLSKRFHLKSKSYGKGENRHLMVWKPIDKTSFMIDSIADFEDEAQTSEFNMEEESSSSHQTILIDTEVEAGAQRTQIAFNYSAQDIRDTSRYRRGQGNNQRVRGQGNNQRVRGQGPSQGSSRGRELPSGRGRAASQVQSGGRDPRSSDRGQSSGRDPRLSNRGQSSGRDPRLSNRGQRASSSQWQSSAKIQPPNHEPRPSLDPYQGGQSQSQYRRVERGRRPYRARGYNRNNNMGYDGSLGGNSNAF